MTLQPGGYANATLQIANAGNYPAVAVQAGQGDLAAQ